jgi:hypothetical protein
MKESRETAAANIAQAQAAAAAATLKKNKVINHCSKIYLYFFKHAVTKFLYFNIIIQLSNSTFLTI